MGTMDITKIEDKIDKVVAGAVPVSMEMGGIRLDTMMQVFEVAKLMSISRTAVPKHLRENPGACLAVCIQALEWKFSPFSVANKSYEVNDRIAYEAQLIVAVINARAPLTERLRYTYEGEGTEMRVTVSGLVKGEATPLTIKTPKIKDIKVKNSPLWTADPEQQLAYYGGRAWCRRHCPETILGIYSVDELENSDPIGSTVTTDKPQIGKRLGGNKGKGFDEAGVAAALEHKPGVTVPATAEKKTPVTVAVGGSTEVVQEAQFELVTDPATEIEGKKSALANCDTAEDVTALIASATAYLKAEKRTDLLNGFLSVADKRMKAIAKKAAPANTAKSEF